MTKISRLTDRSPTHILKSAIHLNYNLKTIKMKKDIEIQNNVMEALKWTPLLNANEIGVAVKNGIVTLSGVVDSYPKKIKAERITRNVKGVHGIAEDITVRLSTDKKKTDTELAQAVLHELEWHSNLNADKIKALVENGHVTLDGQVDWDFQRKSAVKAIWNIKGVCGINNNITVTAAAPATDLKKKIEAAFQRHTHLDASKINLEIKGHKVILSGHVSSWDEKVQAEKAVWSAPGVDTIENYLECAEELV
jgi:osmotically-inducible protein OsmY